MKQKLIYIDAKMHKELKELAVKEGRVMARMIESLINEGLKQKQG